MANLYQWTPHGSVSVFSLPPVQNQDKRAAHVNRLQNAFQELEEMSGVYVSSGANPMYPSYGEIQYTGEISQGYLNTYPSGSFNTSPSVNYGFTFAGLETALYDLAKKVVDGGMGTFTEPLPTGSKAGFGGATLTNRSAECFVNGDYTVTREAGAPIATVQLTFLVPTCQWTYSDGSLVAFV